MICYRKNTSMECVHVCLRFHWLFYSIIGDPFVDCGAICMGPRQMLHYQKLVDDAVIKGAKVLAGGFIPSKDSPLAAGSFYPPTILADIPEHAFIAQEEIFGPIMAIFKVFAKRIYTHITVLTLLFDN